MQAVSEKHCALFNCSKARSVMSRSGSFYWCWMQLADLLSPHGGYCNATGMVIEKIPKVLRML